MRIHKATDEYYEPDPNEISQCFCGICGEEMKVERNRKPVGGFVGAMSGHNRYYDRFWCDNKDKNWHIQARLILRLIKSTPSKKIADLLDLELKEILSTKICTKKAGHV